MHKLDVCGLSCPLPVIKVKEAIDAGPLPIQVTVDAGAPRDNIKRLAENSGLKVKEISAGPGVILLVLSRG
jgi:TusA-related sulfurtransferase